MYFKMLIYPQGIKLNQCRLSSVGLVHIQFHFDVHKIFTVAVVNPPPPPWTCGLSLLTPGQLVGGENLNVLISLSGQSLGLCFHVKVDVRKRSSTVGKG